MLHRATARILARATLLATLGACQDYTFEYRPTIRADARKIDEVVAVVVPVDILFVVDNSGSMNEEIQGVADNISLFASELARIDMDYQVGIITMNLADHVPERGDCGETDTNADGVIDTSNCDGGRLRASPLGRRIFTRPADSERAAWTAEIKSTFEGLKGAGSKYEAGFETTRLAILCSTNAAACTSPETAPVAALNAGFIRPDADLVLIFLSDEDDCSYLNNRDVYLPPSSEPADQLEHLCEATECYAHYPIGLGTFQSCPTGNRIEPVKELPPATDFLDAIVAAKGDDVRRIRAAAVIASMPDAEAEFGFRSAACMQGPADDCGCLLGSPYSTYCAVTASVGQYNRTQADLSNRYCQAMPSNRYFDFLGQLAEQREAAGARPDVLVDSICAGTYNQTIYDIVNNVILPRCFDLGATPARASDVQVSLNGAALAYVPVGSTTAGWSWAPGTRQICLEGGLHKAIGDHFEIFVLASGT